MRPWAGAVQRRGGAAVATCGRSLAPGLFWSIDRPDHALPTLLVGPDLGAIVGRRRARTTLDDTFVLAWSGDRERRIADEAMSNASAAANGPIPSCNYADIARGYASVV